VAGDRPLWRDLVAEQLARSFEVERDRPASAERLAGAVRGVGVASRVALVLVDPGGDGWDDAVRAARVAQPRLGVVVVLSRPAYWQQRRWRQRDERGTMLADALIAAHRSIDDLVSAVDDVLARPGMESIWWLGRTSKHRGAAEAWPNDGAVVRRIRAAPLLHEGLVRLARGEGRKQVAQALGYADNTLTARLREIRNDLGVASDEALGAWAVRTGLLDDAPAGEAVRAQPAADEGVA
jgi:DNA-binding NarL/FixJ family response regulator